MKSRVVVIVRKEKLQEVKKALTEVDNVRIRPSIVVEISGKNAPEAMVVAMTAGASSAFEI